MGAFLWLVIIVSASASRGLEPCPVGPAPVELDLSPCSEWRVDPSGEAELDELTEPTAWQPSSEHSAQLGYVRGAAWLHAVVDLQPGHPDALELAIGEPQTDRVDVWVGPSRHSLRTGERIAAEDETRARPWPSVLLPLADASPGPLDVWVRVESTSVVSLDAELRDPITADQQRDRQRRGFHRFEGVLWTVTGLFAVFALVGRDRVLGAFVTYSACALAYHVAVSAGLTALLPGWADTPTVQTLATLCIAAGVVHARLMLDALALDRGQRVLLVALGVAVVSVWVLPVFVSAPLATAAMATGSIAIVGASVYGIARGARWSGAMLVAWLPFGLVVVSAFAANLGLPCPIPWSVQAARYAFAWQFAVTALALAVRFAEHRLGEAAAQASLLHEAEQRLEAQRALEDNERQLLLLQRREALGRLAGGVAHDFNNLLTVILGNVEDVRDRVSGEDLDAIDDALEAGHRASNLVRQLLIYSRGRPLRREVIAVDTLVEETLALVGRLVGAEISLRVTLEAPGATVDGDRTQLEQILVNLVVNARDAMDGRGHLVVATSLQRGSAGHGARITIQDTGPGIPDEILDTIFEPFFTTKGSAGTGLGLATALGVARDHGGRIDVQTVLGEGTTFDVWLPVEISEERLAVPA